MKRIEIAALLAVGMIVGCMAGAPLPGADTPGGTPGALETMRPTAALSGALVLDRADVALGTTVEFHRMPSAMELQDASEEFALRHVVIELPAWPQGNIDLPRFQALPPEADAIVILPGYPPDRSSLAAWNYAAGPIRMVLVVDGPPGDSGILDDLNLARHLERVVARMERPSRAGFEHLQRPLSFLHAVD